MEKTFTIQAYSPKQIKTLYNVGSKTWKSWLQPICKAVGELKGKVYTPKQIQIIVEHLGEPGT